MSKPTIVNGQQVVSAPTTERIQAMLKDLSVKAAPFYRGRLCPPLTMGALAANPPSAIARPDGSSSSTAEGCQGPMCMWFKVVTDQQGGVVDGQCSVALGPIAINQLAGMIGASLQQNRGVQPQTPVEAPKV